MAEVYVLLVALKKVNFNRTRLS